MSNLGVSVTRLKLHRSISSSCKSLELSLDLQVPTMAP